MSATFLEKIRSARKLEWIVLLVAVALAALLLFDADGNAGSATELERRLEKTLCSVEGAGKVHVMVTQRDDGSIAGVLIVSEGAGDIAVRLRLAQAAKTLLDIELCHIEVMRMG